MNGLALCAGAAGLELGLSLASDRFRAVCYVEREAFAASVLAKRMRDGALADAPIWSDLATFDGRPWRGVVDIVTAGYPCQPFSQAGLQRGEEDERHLWPEVRRVVEEVAPSLVFAENVAAHLRIGFDVVARDLQAMGYRVAASLWTASECGAPHLRERLFWLAAQSDLSDPVRECLREQRERFREQRREPRAGVAGNDGPAKHVADSDGRRLEAVGVEEPTGLEGSRGNEPNRHDPGNWWGAKPGVGRVADGVARRLDRLRLTGNGVVPIVAARAFNELARELSE